MAKTMSGGAFAALALMMAAQPEFADVMPLRASALPPLPGWPSPGGPRPRKSRPSAVASRRRGNKAAAASRKRNR